MSGQTRRGDTVSATVRARGSTAVGPCLFLVARGHEPRAASLRLQLGRHAEVEVRRGTALDVAARPGTPAVVELAIDDTKVSARHARLENCLGRWCVKDDHSKNGTFVNGERVAQAALSDGDMIDIGDTIFVFREGIPLGGELAHRPPPSARRGLSSLLPAVQAVLDELAKVAPAPLPFPILVEGETGTGKEVIARAIHELSGRPGNLVPVNCGGLSGDRVEAELYGWKKGAFTDANEDNPGLVQAAHRGTLFLDEIGDLPLADQTALLRVLQEREVLPLAATRPVAVDFRVVAATHRPLDAMAGRGEFRDDLLARLSGYRLRLLPLRERREDLGLFLAEVLRARREAEGCRMTIAALRALLRHDWPTNIRGLEQALVRALVTCTRGMIDVEDLPPAVRTGGGVARTPAPVPRSPAPPDDPKRERLIALLREHRGNVAAVARAMGKARMQIHRWLERYGLQPDEYRG